MRKSLGIFYDFSNKEKRRCLSDYREDMERRDEDVGCIAKVAERFYIEELSIVLEENDSPRRVEFIQRYKNSGCRACSYFSNPKDCPPILRLKELWV